MSFYFLDVAKEVLDRSVLVEKEHAEFDYSFIDKEYVLCMLDSTCARNIVC